MANDVGSITASLKLESAAFIREMNRAAQATAKSTSQMQRSLAGLQTTFAGIGTAAKGFVAGFLSVAAVRQLASMATNAAKFADGIGDVATALGISAEALQRYRQAGEQADVSIEQMDNSLKLFQKNVAAGKLTDQSFEAFIQRIREAPTQIEKVRIAQEGLGKQFQTGLLLASQSAEAFSANMENASVVSQQAIDNADTLTKSWARLENALSAGFAEGLLGGLNSDLRVSVQTLKDVEAIAKAVAGALRTFAADVMEMARSIQSVADNTIDFFAQAQRAAERGQQTGLVGGKGGLVQRAPGSIPISDLPGGGSTRAPGGLPLLMQQAASHAKAIEEQATKTGEAIGEWKTDVKAADEEMQKLPPHIQAISDLAQSFGDTMAASFTNAIIEGEKFSDMLEGLLKQLAQMALSAAFRMIMGNLIGQPAGGGGLLGTMFHGGGIVGAGGPQRLVPAAAFAAAPRFHNGFMPGETPAILKRGEGVFTPEQMKAMGGGVTVNVINKNDSDVKVSQQENANGGIDIEVMIDQIVGRKLGQPGSSSNRMLSQMGVKPQPIRR